MAPAFSICLAGVPRLMARFGLAGGDSHLRASHVVTITSHPTTACRLEVIRGPRVLSRMCLHLYCISKALGFVPASAMPSASCDIGRSATSSARRANWEAHRPSRPVRRRSQRRSRTCRKQANALQLVGNKTPQHTCFAIKRFAAHPRPPIHVLSSRRQATSHLRCHRRQSNPGRMAKARQARLLPARSKRRSNL